MKDKSAMSNSLTERNTSLDLLRVLLMLMIVFGHSIYHGSWGGKLNDINGINNILTHMLYGFLIVHVDCFVILSGYFLHKKHFRLKRIYRLWWQMLFYSTAIYLVLVFIGISKFSAVQAIKALFPVTQGRYWFMTVYLLMYLLTPVMNAAIERMDEKEHRKALLIFFSVFIVLQNIVFWREFSTVNDRSPLLFCFLYFLGAYLYKYPIRRKMPWALCYCLLSLFNGASYFIMKYTVVQWIGSSSYASIFLSYNSVTVILSAFCLFMAFSRITIKSDRLVSISKLSPYVFGVYLIHDQQEMRPFLWYTVLKIPSISDKWFLIPVLFADAMLVFFISLMVEYGRKKITTRASYHKH